MWLTNKETGGKFNTDWINEEESKKQKQIASNKKQADKLNNKMPSKFEEHAEEYVAGGIDVDRAFSKEDLQYIKNNLTTTSKPLYRIEESEYTADKLDEDEFDVDDFKFNGSFRSFSDDFNFIKSTMDEDSDNYAGMEAPVVFEITGAKQHFDLEPYTKEYAKQFGSQGESFVGGRFKMIGEDMKKVNGKFIRIIKISQKG